MVRFALSPQAEYTCKQLWARGTLNPKPSTLNCKPEKPKPSTLQALANPLSTWRVMGLGTYGYKYLH